ncbi:hypothetical protein [Bacillus massiliigorillae]|uniref:hypothetical protein n=1 Tax=Bacillus massiliigorillae TaxID=1243664 RepID=UPI0003A6AE9A|nr:hypothetical protein [Bacillus massiliigorillae]
MKLKISLLFILLSLVLVIVIYIFNKGKDIKNVDNITNRLTKSISFEEYINSAKSVYKFKENTIHINLESNGSFENLDLNEKLILLEYFAKQLRYFIHIGMDTISSQNVKITIETITKNNEFQVMNEVPYKKAYEASESTFFINGKYNKTSRLLRMAIHNEIAKDPNSAHELEIIDYAKYIYNLITSNGKYYDYERDTPIILDAIQEKYGVTLEEFDEIYMKHYLNLDL